VEFLMVLATLADQTQFLLGVLGAALGLGLVIFLHELGHFAVAKWCDVHVERFSIGFGPVLFSWKRGETEYALSAIPFGGYVKMLGQDDADPSQMTSEEIAADPRSYIAKNVWQRMAIISAGVTMNILSAVVFYAVVFGLGREIPPPRIGTAATGMPAWIAGLRRGDEVTHFNGRPVTNWPDVAISVAVSTGPIELRGRHRDGSSFDVTIDPDTSGTRPQIGIENSLGLTLRNDPTGTDPVAIPGTAAARAQPPFEPGDQIIRIGDHDVSLFADFQDHLAARQGEPTTITVKRKNRPEPVVIQVDSNYFRTLGLRLAVGRIAAIRSESPAEAAGLKVGDKLTKLNGKDIGIDIDPMRLPDEFARLQGQTVELQVQRSNPSGGPSEVTITLTPENRPGWLEQPQHPGEPLSIPAIGAAFHMVAHVLQVEPDGPAATAGIRGDTSIQKVELVLPEGAPADVVKPRTLDISLEKENADNWGFAFRMMQELRQREVWLTVKEKDQAQARRVQIVPMEDKSWPMPTLGLRMEPLEYLERADSVGMALRMSYTESRNAVLRTYLTLYNLFIGRLSYRELHGPLSIAGVAYHSAKAGIVPLLEFLAFLSVNLAVVNFLPIPVLDGGHMVFLTWEAITRRRPSERVLIGAQYAGLVLLLGLMCMVFYLDLSRIFGGGQ